MKKIILSIEGMTCSACSNGLEKYLNKQNGIKSASVNLVMANASIEYDEKVVNKEKLEEFVKKAGFKSLGEFKEIKFEEKSKKNKVIFIVSTVLAVILMYISMGHMIGLPALLDMTANAKEYVITLWIFATIFLIYGIDILKNGYKNLIHRTPNMDTLVGIGVLSSYIYSIYSMVCVLKGDTALVHNVYFEASAMVIYFVKLGRYLDSLSKDKTKEAIGKLVKITPESATLIVDNVEKVVTINEVKKGDILITKPGEKIAVDGEITKGKAHVDESFITGESKPVSKEVGDKVIAGSINYDGYIEYTAEKIGKESTISEIVKLVLQASNTKAPIAKIADKVSGIFVPLVLVIAILTLVIYLILGHTFAESLITFVTVLVVACPCSLGLATPLAIVVSEGLCASNGILIKKSEILENAEKTNAVVLDKTGTITYGTLKISKIISYVDTPEEMMLKVASLESKSTHPISKAFTDYLEEKKMIKLDVKEFENITGLGLIGKVMDKTIIVGNSKILEKYNILNEHKEDEEKLAKAGNSIVYVACLEEGKITNLIGVNDIVRENVYDVIKELNEKNIETIMLTGDNRDVAEKIAKDIGITRVVANVLPSGKTDVIKELKENGKYVMMCGDGINDSPALKTADIGISVNSGTDIAMDSSDVILMRNDLGSILNLVNISKRTIKIIKQNLFWAFFYNILMIPIAIGIFKNIGISINPMIASLAMVISSLTVIVNTLRLKSIKKA